MPEELDSQGCHFHQRVSLLTCTEDDLVPPNRWGGTDGAHTRGISAGHACFKSKNLASAAFLQTCNKRSKCMKHAIELNSVSMYRSFKKGSGQVLLHHKMLTFVSSKRARQVEHAWHARSTLFFSYATRAFIFPAQYYLLAHDCVAMYATSLGITISDGRPQLFEFTKECVLQNNPEQTATNYLLILGCADAVEHE
eukprot:117180-Pelagomonas_calceolata.AAC.5